VPTQTTCRPRSTDSYHADAPLPSSLALDHRCFLTARALNARALNARAFNARAFNARALNARPLNARAYNAVAEGVADNAIAYGDANNAVADGHAYNAAAYSFANNAAAYGHLGFVGFPIAYKKMYLGMIKGGFTTRHYISPVIMRWMHNVREQLPAKKLILLQTVGCRRSQTVLRTSKTLKSLCSKANSATQVSAVRSQGMRNTGVVKKKSF
jgi:hypothetical protein